MIFLLIPLVLVILALGYWFGIRGRSGHPELEVFHRWSFAHRGLHSDGIPENSMAAFKAAKEGGYGVELDVHLLADGNLAVIHDSVLERVTGLPGTIEDLTTEQLKECRLCGTNETVPQLQQVLELFQGEAPLIVELKSARNNHVALSKAVCQMLDEYNGPYCLESFDPRCILWLKRNRPELIRGQLSENYFEKGRPRIPVILKFIMTHNLANWITRPDFVAYRYTDRHCTVSNALCLRRMSCVSWTLTTPQEYETAVQEGWIPIFEGFLPDPEGLK